MSIPVDSKRFMVGKYEVIAQPLPHSVHMLRYTVFLHKTRIGAMVSVPTESDCRFLEKPPIVPPLKIFYVTHRPGRRRALPDDQTLGTGGQRAERTGRGNLAAARAG